MICWVLASKRLVGSFGGEGKVLRRPDYSLEESSLKKGSKERRWEI